MKDTGPILVALDGSELAEGVLPYATALGVATGAGLTLLTVWEGTESEMGRDFPSMAMEVEQNARQYFQTYHDGIVARLSRAGTKSVIREGDSVEEILRAVGETHARAIAIHTHGRSGIGRWFYGSVAGGLLKRSPVPILTVGPHVPARSGDVTFTHIAVPLDGQQLSEQALSVAVDLTKKTGAQLSLVRAVNWAVQTYPYTLPTSYIPQVDQELEAGAKAYLRRKEGDIREQVPSVDAFVVRGAPADGLLDFVAGHDVDLVVMTTHARGGLLRSALGSVADRMLQANTPVLLIPPEAAG